jgi:hypothetical protein
VIITEKFIKDGHIQPNMPINDYVAAYEKGSQENDTLQLKLLQASVALELKLVNETTRRVDKNKLKDEAVQTTCAKAFYDILKSYAVERAGSTTTDEDVKNDLAFGTFGINLEDVTQYLAGKKERFEEGEFRLRHLPSNTAFGYFQRRNTDQKPKAKLKLEDAEEVVRYTSTVGKVDHKKLSIDDMAGLLGEFMREKTITETFLADKDYHIKPAAPPAAGTGRSSATAPN